VLRRSPEAEVSAEPCEVGRLVAGVHSDTVANTKELGRPQSSPDARLCRGYETDGSGGRRVDGPSAQLARAIFDRNTGDAAGSHQMAHQALADLHQQQAAAFANIDVFGVRLPAYCWWSSRF
jgi:hypothetical protein